MALFKELKSIKSSFHVRYNTRIVENAHAHTMYMHAQQFESIVHESYQLHSGWPELDVSQSCGSSRDHSPSCYLAGWAWTCSVSTHARLCILPHSRETLGRCLCIPPPSLLYKLWMLQLSWTLIFISLTRCDLLLIPLPAWVKGVFRKKAGRL